MRWWPFGRESRASIEDPSTPISNPAQWFLNLFTGGQSAAGVPVTPEIALTVPAAWRSVNLISETIASLPLQLFKIKGEERIPASKDALHHLLHDAVNETLTSFRWRRLFMRHLLLHGRHFTRIERNQANKVTSLFPLTPKNVTVERRNGRVRYRVRTDRGTEILEPSEILHFTGLDADDGLDGVSPIGKLKDAIGFSKALEIYGSKFFSRGARPDIVLEIPGKLSPEAVDRLKASVEKTHAGVENSHGVMVAEDGVKIHTISTENEHAQFLETRKMQRLEVANAFNVPLFFLGDSDPAKANSEQQALFFVKHTIRPWLVMIEQEMNLKLIGRAPRRKFIKFNVDGLLRGDFKTRMDGLAKAVQNALNTPNEARALLDYPPLPGGNQLYLQQNMSDLDSLEGMTQPENTDEQEDEEDE